MGLPPVMAMIRVLSAVMIFMLQDMKRRLREAGLNTYWFEYLREGGEIIARIVGIVGEEDVYFVAGKDMV
jgi:hypothetical protein